MFNSLFCYNKSGKNSNNDATEHNNGNNSTSFPEFFDFGFGFGSFSGNNAENFFLSDSLFGTDFQSKNIFDNDMSSSTTNSASVQANNKSKHNNNENNILLRPIKTSILNKTNFPEFVKPLPLKRFTKVKRGRENESAVHIGSSKTSAKVEGVKHCHNNHDHHSSNNNTAKLIHQHNIANKIKYEDIKCEIQANKYAKEILLESIHRAKSIHSAIDNSNTNRDHYYNSINIGSPLKAPAVNEYQMLNNKSTAKKNNAHNGSSKSVASNNNSNVTVYNESPGSPKDTSLVPTENNYLTFKEQKKTNINYNYLLQSFNVSINEYPSVFEIQTFLHYEQHLLDQPQHMHKHHLHFGPNPISLFIDWATWLKDEKQKKLPFQSRDLCNDLSSTLNSISLTMSSFPILRLPSSDDVLIQASPEHSKTSFHCQLCGYSFNSGQGLGGHMSRRHPDKSDKFKRKKFIREKRSLIREKLTEAKRFICSNHDINYDELAQSKEGKLIIRSVIIENKDEFKTVYSQLKKALYK